MSEPIRYRYVDRDCPMLLGKVGVAVSPSPQEPRSPCGLGTTIKIHFDGMRLPVWVGLKQVEIVQRVKA